METSKLTSKCQATIPLAVRRMLGLKKGDEIVFRADGGKVFIDRIDPNDKAWKEWAAYARTAFPEWASPEDDNLFKDG